MLVRKFAPEDAESLSRLIIRNLRIMNSQDYSDEAIEALVPFYEVEKIIDNAEMQYMVVAIEGDDLVGTASLDEDRVRNVFVQLDKHRRGIGRLLIANIEGHARANKLARIYLYSGLSAKGFYTVLGYETVGTVERDLDGASISVIKMQKDL